MIQTAAISRITILSPAAVAPGGDAAAFGLSLATMLDMSGQAVAASGNGLPQMLPSPAPVSGTPVAPDTGAVPVAHLPAEQAGATAFAARQRPGRSTASEPGTLALASTPGLAPAERTGPESSPAMRTVPAEPVTDDIPELPLPSAAPTPDPELLVRTATASGDGEPGKLVEDARPSDNDDTVDGAAGPLFAPATTLATPTLLRSTVSPDALTAMLGVAPPPAAPPVEVAAAAAVPFVREVVAKVSTAMPRRVDATPLVATSEPAPVPDFVQDASSVPSVERAFVSFTDATPAVPETQLPGSVVPLATNDERASIRPADPTDTPLAHTSPAAKELPEYATPSMPQDETRAVSTGALAAPTGLGDGSAPRSVFRTTGHVGRADASPMLVVDNLATSAERPPLPLNAAAASANIAIAAVQPRAITPGILASVAPAIPAVQAVGIAAAPQGPKPATVQTPLTAALLPSLDIAGQSPPQDPAVSLPGGSPGVAETPPLLSSPTIAPERSAEVSPTGSTIPAARPGEITANRPAAPITLVGPPAQMPVIVAGASAPAFRLFAQAIHAARRDETASDPLALVAVAAIDATHAALPVTATQGSTLNMTDHRWPVAMIDRIEALRDAASAAADTADTSMRIIPASLGTIDVSVRRDGDTVHVHFAAEQAATRSLLAEAQPRLAELAESRGLKLGQASVGAGGEQNAQRQPDPQSTRVDPTPTPASRDDEPELATTRVA